MTSTATETGQAAIIYQGQFGPFTVEESDRREVVLYRAGLIVAAICFALGTSGILWQGEKTWILHGISLLYTVFCLALGLSLIKIHIYLKPLHRLLQGFWLMGGLASLAIAHFSPDPFALTLYRQPVYLWGVGFVFAALSGIFFKEAFCFNRLETKVLTPLVPLLILGHMFHFLPEHWESILLALWAVNFLIFACRKAIQPIPPDIGDKSVFEYLANGNH